MSTLTYITEEENKEYYAAKNQIEELKKQKYLIQEQIEEKIKDNPTYYTILKDTAPYN